MSMEESATKGLELLESNGSDAEIRKSSSIRRICVEGYDTSLSEYHADAALRELFSSCGEIAHIYIPKDGHTRSPLNRFAFIYIRGEVAYEKALELTGSDVGGWKVLVKPYPLTKSYLDSELSPGMRKAGKSVQRRMSVMGYDTKSRMVDVKSMLLENFSSSGNYLTGACVPPKPDGSLYSKAILFITGEDAIEKLMKRDVEGYHIQVDKVCRPIHPGKLRVGCLIRR